jgi:hypothetical protein
MQRRSRQRTNDTPSRRLGQNCKSGKNIAESPRIGVKRNRLYDISREIDGHRRAGEALPADIYDVPPTQLKRRLL